MVTSHSSTNEKFQKISHARNLSSFGKSTSLDSNINIDNFIDLKFYLMVVEEILFCISSFINKIFRL